MNTERAQVGLGFWLWWMLASAVVPSLVVTMVLVIYESLTDSDPQQQLLAALWGLVLVLVLATITISQWLVLRRQIPRAGWWVVAGIVGLVVGSLVGLVAGGAVGFGVDVISRAARAALISVDSTFGLAVGLLVSLAVGMPSALVTITIAQWLVLRSHVSRAGWWLLVPNWSLLLGIGWLAILTTLSGTIGAILGAVVINSLGIVVYGAVSGGVLVWLLRQPVKEQPSLPIDTAEPEAGEKSVIEEPSLPQDDPETEGGGMKRWAWALIVIGGLIPILFLIGQVIRDGPNAQAIEHFDRGVENQRQVNFALAIEEYTEAIALDPQYADAYVGRAFIYYRMGDLDLAIADLEQVIALDPQFAPAYHPRGRAYYDKGEFDQAIADYDQAIALDPEVAQTYISRAYAYSDKGEFDRAIADYDQAIALDPEDASSYNNRGVAYSDKGDHDRAIADYDQAIALDPQTPYVYGNRGLAYSDKGEFDQAIADFDQAIAFDPRDPYNYLDRGLAYSDKGELDRAIADIERAIALGLNATKRQIADEALEELEQSVPSPSSFPPAIEDTAPAFTSNYSFGSPNQGLSLSNALVNNAQYSIEMVFNFSHLSGYRKVIDFWDLARDGGLYTSDTALEFYPEASGPSDAFTQDVDAHLLVTRDASTNVFIAYVNGVQQISFIDSGGNTVFTSNVIQFFKDDFKTQQDEVSAGAVDRILIYDVVLTPSEVTALFQGTGGPAASHIYELNGSFEDDLGGPALSRP